MTGPLTPGPDGLTGWQKAALRAVLNVPDDDRDPDEHDLAVVLAAEEIAAEEARRAT